MQVSDSLSAGYGGYGFHAAASLAFSQDVTSTSAMQSQSEQSGTLSITSVSCFTSKMEMRNFNLHESFLQALDAAVDAEDFAEIVQKYGSHYYTTARIFAPFYKYIIKNNPFIFYFDYSRIGR